MSTADTPEPQRYDPGWSDATWNAAEPEPTPRPTALQTARAVLRFGAFATVTLVLLPSFFIARALGGGRDRFIAAAWCGAGAWVLGVRRRVVGAPMREGGALLVNHASWIDILVMGASAPVHFVSKAEVAGWPLFGWIGKISNTVFIARRRGAAGEQERILSDRAHMGHLLCLFPEGTSTDGLRVLPFKSALFRAFMPDPSADRGAARVQPVTIHYAAPHGLPRSFYGWWGRRGLFDHLYAVATLSSGGVATIMFHEPMDPSAFEDRKALAAEAHRIVAGGLARAASEAG